MAERDARYAMFQAKTGGLMRLEEKTALDELKRVLQERCGATSVVVYGGNWKKGRSGESPLYKRILAEGVPV